MLNAVDATSNSHSKEGDRPTSQLRIYMALFIPIVAIAGMWSLATPVDGSPDEYRHIIYGYALATGQVTEDSVSYSVPAVLGFNRSACFAFQPEQSAACDQSAALLNSELITTSTSANNYPRFYYRLAGWPLALMPDDTGIRLARLAGVLLGGALIALGLAAAQRLHGPWLRLGALLSATPMVFFLLGSFNPHGLELAASLAFITALLALIINPGVAGNLAKGTVLVSVPPLVLSRPNGFIWPFLLLALILLVVGNPKLTVSRLGTRFCASLVGLSALCILWALKWQMSVGGRDTGAGVIGPTADRFEQPSGTVLQILTKTLNFPGDWIGNFGWLDMRVSSVTLFVWFSAVGGLLLIGLVLRPSRLIWLSGTSILLAVAFTVAVESYYRISLGVSVAQGRYVLPLAMLAVCLLALNVGGVEAVQLRLPGVLASLWVIGSLLAFGEALRRYSVGVSMRAPAGTWEPPISVFLMVLIGGLAMLALADRVSRRAAA